MIPSLLQNKLTNFFLLLLATLCVINANAQIRITEYLYSGANGEFVEFTNVGNTSIDMTGWSFDDATRTPGVHNLSAFGIVQPGESVIVTESTPGVFRAAWGLCNGIKITGGYTNDNLGRADEINLYDSLKNLVDRLTYDDQTLGGPRANGKSAWVNTAGLGANMPAQWTLSSAGDAEGSFTSAGGDVGSPGKSTRAIVAYNPCTVANGAPTIVMDVITTSDFIDGGITTPPVNGYSFSGVIDDPTDPGNLYGINFTIGDDATPADNLIVGATSSNTAVVPNANITLSGSGISRNIKIKPAGIGYSTITFTVSDGTSTSSFTINYAASANSAAPSATIWPTGISDASTAIALDSAYYLTADDEQDVINVYSRSASGLPVKSYNYSSNLALPDPSKPEVDAEASTESKNFPGRIYVLGSMSNGKDPFDNKPNRNRLFAVDVSGTGAITNFSFVGYYGNLRNTLIAWGDAHGYNFSASAAAGVDSKSPSGFAAEGMVFGPDSTGTLYIGMRAPLVPTATRKNAVIAPILNFESWFNNGAPVGDPTFGEPIELNLGGRGIRELARLSNGSYIILAGNPGSDPVTGAIYKWSGKPQDTAILVNNPTTDGLNMEGVMQVNTIGQSSINQLQLISDEGDNVYYNDGIGAKDLGENNFKKFRVDDATGLDLCLTVTGDTTAVATGSFTWYGTTYTSTPATPPTHDFTTASGCDSIVTLHLTIIPGNKIPTVHITSPTDGSVFTAGSSAVLQADAADSDGAIRRVVFYNNGIRFAEDSTAPYLFNGTNIEAGNYVLTAKAFDDKGDSAVSDTVRVTFTGCSGSGFITGQGYTGIAGAQVINLTSNPKFPNSPDVVANLSNFEYGPNLGDNYGGWVRGFICAPISGPYTFYIASDEQSELWLSKDDNPVNKVKIAFLNSPVPFRAWNTYFTQKSAPVTLVKGVRYYIESLHKENTGNDHLSVAWTLPGGAFEGPIPGSRLSPFDSSSVHPTGSNFENAMHVAEEAANGQGLQVIAGPNPSTSFFTLTTKSNSDELLTITVTDILGGVIERRTRVTPNTTIEVGNNFRAGVYFVELTQGVRKVRLKLVHE